MSKVIVRRGALDDASGIAHVQAWREAYARQLPAEVLDGLEEAPGVERWATIIDDGVTDMFVAEAGRRVIGWATASGGRNADAPVDREPEGIYVLEDVYGTGAGQKLVDAALGDSSAYLWMLDDNPRAETFYRRNAFQSDDVEKEGRMSGHPVHIVRLVPRDAG